MAILITIMVVLPITATTTIRIVFHDHGSHHDNHDGHNDPIGGLSDTTRNSDTDGSNDKKDTTLDPSFPQQHIDQPTNCRHPTSSIASFSMRCRECRELGHPR